MSDRPPEFEHLILPLLSLLTHKMRNTLPPSSQISSTAELNQALTDQLQKVRQHALFPLIGDKEFNDLFSELEALVAGWGAEGGTTHGERKRLAKVVEELLND